MIKCFVKENMILNEIIQRSQKCMVESSPSYSTIKKWVARFICGSTCFEDDPHEEHQKSATTSEIIKQLHDIVLDD